jgi:hypothetical protein
MHRETSRVSFLMCPFVSRLGCCFDNAPPGSSHYDTYLCHEGDWERVTVFLDPEDELADPRAVNFDAHGEKSQVTWADVDKEDGRLVVYSGLGVARFDAQAGVPLEERRQRRRRRPPLADLGPAQPVRQAWWGYGGAWGAAGASGDLTGPLGPSPYKEPPELV